MLTKEERAAIAERLNSCEGNGFCKFYEAITNREAPELTTFVDDIKVMLPVILDLCDTSNMIELPRDKDGEVIHVGDMLYCGSGTAYKAKKLYIMATIGKFNFLTRNSLSQFILTPIPLPTKSQ